MRKTQTKCNEYSRLLSMDALMQYTGLGRPLATKMGKDAGAYRKIGRRAVFDRKKIDEYIDNLPDAVKEV